MRKILVAALVAAALAVGAWIGWDAQKPTQPAGTSTVACGVAPGAVRPHSVC